MTRFQTAYNQLNAAQKQAVDTVDGPLLVLAGPGTGKTQLLGMRVANILIKTDTLPQNILCLTFTESGAANMRERLSRFIGQAAYDVQIATYHEFGGSLIRRFPEYFTETRLERPIDDLGKHQIIEAIVSEMSYLNPLKQTQHHLSDLISTISELKRALLTGDDLRELAAENHSFMTLADMAIGDVLSDFTRMPSKAAVAVPLFREIEARLTSLVPAAPINDRFTPLATLATTSLNAAITDADTTDKTTPLTKWKNDWLAKNNDNQFVIDGALANKRLEALADVSEQYHDALEKQGYYDFDDMILRSISALENNDDLRYSLQERYQYLLLDEFQDTNAAQFKLVELLTDNPVHENRPNVMAVGDDDQAIYAFQGANYSNMLDFFNAYREVGIINLTENYRSHADILATAHKVASQIEARLQHHFPGLEKLLVASNSKLPKQSELSRHEFISDIAQYDWIANEIEQLIKKGQSPHDIAVLAPKHKFLEQLVAHLNQRHIPVAYEKRENILEASVIRQLLGMSKLVLAIRDSNQAVAGALWPEVLSYDFWQLPASTIWQTSWAVSDSRGTLNWSQALLENELFIRPALLLLTLAAQADTLPLEQMLDHLIGTAAITTHDERLAEASSPLRDYLLAPDPSDVTEPELFYHTLSHLAVLRAKLREHQQAADHPLVLRDLIDFVALYERSGQQMLNTSPYNQHADAVQLMTVFKAKGLEFNHVFLPSIHDDVWGETSRGGSNRLTLPANLAPVRPGATTPDERLRIFFVAITRARLGLHFTSFTSSFSGKATRRLKYMDEQETADGGHAALVLPEYAQPVIQHNDTPLSIEQLELDWRTKHFEQSDASLKDLLSERIKDYQLSPTHLNMFTDLIYGGPRAFFFNILLRFPTAPGVDGMFGTAMHETLEWVQQSRKKQAELPAISDIEAHFSANLAALQLPETTLQQLQERGHHALRAYIPARGETLQANDISEANFRNEGVFVGKAHLNGKIDRLIIDKATKRITVVDYKTGASYGAWKKDAKLHKYRQQLYGYKLLIEGSHSYRGYTVDRGILEFVEPDTNGVINSLELTFNDDELARTKQLLEAMWQKVQDLDMPDVSQYGTTLKDIERFEDDLLTSTV